MNHDKTAVILLNLGGPEQLEDVRPFLFNLFSDRQIIRLGPPFLQKPLAWWIAKRRAPKSRKYYEQIGGGSPLNRITAQQCAALERELAAAGDIRVVMAMRYWPPYAAEVLRRLAAEGVTRIVALSLYPHYSVATTGSSLSDLRQAIANSPAPFTMTTIESWPEEPLYIDCLAQRIVAGLEENNAKTEVVYSAHSLPVKFIEEGDPYMEHLRQTIRALEAKTGTRGHLCFQSRSGPVEWLSPSTPETIEELAQTGCQRILLVPLSFVSDHVETLCEIDIQYREKIEALGMQFARTPSLNTDPQFIQGLAALVRTAL